MSKCGPPVGYRPHRLTAFLLESDEEKPTARPLASRIRIKAGPVAARSRTLDEHVPWLPTLPCGIAIAAVQPARKTTSMNLRSSEGHAASFALLAYASCWIKCQHQTEFLAAMLNSQPLGFYSPSQLVQDV